jgi:hypothetical protein
MTGMWKWSNVLMRHFDKLNDLNGIMRCALKEDAIFGFGENLILNFDSRILK